MSGAPTPAILAKVLGYQFHDDDLLIRAMTHASAIAGNAGAGNTGAGRTQGNYQRLEYLGDRVLGLVVAHMLFERYVDADEGELSRRLAALVRRETCADVAGDIGLGEHIWLGDGEAQTGGRHKEAILGDVCESVIGAIYLDGGLAEARDFIIRNWGERMDNTTPRLKDAKTTLQEWAHAKGLGMPVYRLLSRTGPDHAPLFKISVSLPGLAPGEGSGPNKRGAEQEAATSLLKQDGDWNRDETGDE